MLDRITTSVTSRKRQQEERGDAQPPRGRLAAAARRGPQRGAPGGRRARGHRGGRGGVALAVLRALILVARAGDRADPVADLVGEADGRLGRGGALRGPLGGAARAVEAPRRLAVELGGRRHRLRALLEPLRGRVQLRPQLGPLALDVLQLGPQPSDVRSEPASSFASAAARRIWASSRSESRSSRRSWYSDRSPSCSSRSSSASSARRRSSSRSA